MVLTRSRSRRSLPVLSVLTGASTQPRTSARVAAAPMCPRSVVVTPVKSPKVDLPSKLRVPRLRSASGQADWWGTGAGVMSRAIASTGLQRILKCSLDLGVGARLQSVAADLREQRRAREA